MAPAPLAVLGHADAVRVVALGLVGLVVASLAVLAGEGHSDANVSTGHGFPEVEGKKVELARLRAKKRPARGESK
jgi:hypothetical protein